MTRPRSHEAGHGSATSILLVVIAATSLCAAHSLQAAPPPAGKTYFTVLLGFDDSYSWEGDCLRFNANAICTQEGLCGTWTHTEPAGAETAFAFEFDFQQQGTAVHIEGQGRIDDRGKNSSLAGVARLDVGGQSVNFGFTGREAKRKQCKKLLRQWDLETTPPQPPQDGNCLDRAAFGKPARSPYVLPFPVGKTYHLSQTYCYLYSTHRNEYAYDFDIPLGAEIVAARAGTVLTVRDELPNNSPHPDANFIQIRHDDGTVASYIHIKQDSVPVAAGQRVAQGDRIAESAMSGTIEPHLHFVVFRDHPGVDGEDVSVTFSNVDGPIDALGGLIQDQDYTAVFD